MSTSETIDKRDLAPERSRIALQRSDLSSGTLNLPEDLDRLKGPLRTTAGTSHEQGQTSLELATHVQAMIRDIHAIIQKVDEFKLAFSLNLRKRNPKRNQ